MGFVLDDIDTFGKHIEMVANKAKARAAYLFRVMKNIGGPQSGKRELLSRVVHSILLYGSSI